MGTLPVWAFIGGVLLIGTTIGLIASALLFLTFTGNEEDEGKP